MFVPSPDAGATAGVAAVFASALPLNLGLLAAAVIGVLAGLLAEVVGEGRTEWAP